VLVADESTTALDVTTQSQILELFDDLRQRLRMALLLITHDLGVVAGHTDRVMVMYSGQEVELGPTEDLFATPRHRYTEALLASMLDLLASPGATPQSHVTWHLLHMAENWETVPKDGMRLPSYGTNGTGVVFLAGEVTPYRNYPDDPYIAILPKGLRPAHDLMLLAVGPARDVQGTEIPAEVEVLSNGEIIPGAGAYILSGVSFVIGE
jgi:hypothetical protein